MAQPHKWAWGERTGIIIDLWKGLRGLIRSETTQTAILTWAAGHWCASHGCDKAQYAAYALGGLKMLQKAAADFGKASKDGGAK